MKRILFIALVAPAMVACKAKITSNAPALPQKPQTCTRTLVREVPAQFKGDGTVNGSVRTFNCETIVVATDRNDVIYLAKFTKDGVLDEAYGDRGYFRPLMNRNSTGLPKVERLAIVNEDFMAMGTHGLNTRAFMAFRFSDDGYLDLGFGPTKEGVLRAPTVADKNVIRVGAPILDNGQIRVPLRLEDLGKGTEEDREISFPLDGSTIN